MMNIKLQAALFSVGLATLGLWATPAQADEWNKRTTLTFDQPIEVPGHVLTPGRYVFQLADLSSDRDVVQIFSEDKQGMDHLVTTLMAVPDYTVRTPEKSMFTFEERHVTSPEALHAWFYPGDNYGWEFVYPKSERLLAAANTAPAPVRPAPPPAVTPAPKPVAQTAKPAVTKPAPKPVEHPATVAQNRPPASQSSASRSAQPPAKTPQRLPQTASNVPLVAGFGSLMMLLGLGLMLGRRLFA